VGTNGTLAQALNPFTVTVIGAYVAPGGTGTISWVGEAVETLPRTAPKYTMLAPGDVLKFVPEMTITVPILPELGATLEMAGAPCE
jgi:hypothetical protein